MPLIRYLYESNIPALFTLDTTTPVQKQKVQSFTAFFTPDMIAIAIITINNNFAALFTPLFFRSLVEFA